MPKTVKRCVSLPVEQDKAVKALVGKDAKHPSYSAVVTEAVKEYTLRKAYKDYFKDLPISGLCLSPTGPCFESTNGRPCDCH